MILSVLRMSTAELNLKQSKQLQSSCSQVKKTQIWHICKVFLPTKGGIQTVVASLCDVKNNDIENTIITTAQTTSIHASQTAKVYTAKSYMELLSLPIAPKIFSLIKLATHKADILVSHYPFPLVDLSLVLFRPKKLIVYWHSNIFSQKISKYLLFPFTYLMLKQAKKIVVASPNTIEHSHLLSHFKKKCEIIPYSLNLPKTIENTPSTKKETNYYLCIGRHVEYKGFEYAIKAMAHTNSRLIIIGDGPLYEKHVSLIKKLNLHSKVTLLKGINDQERDSYIKNCRALILPSIYPSEAFALVQIEAMRFGKPIINTSLNSGVPWVARHNQEAITVTPSSSQAISKAIGEIESNSEFRKILGHNAKKRYYDTFQFKVFEDQVHSLYSHILAKNT